jgi:hypothetical protein
MESPQRPKEQAQKMKKCPRLLLSVVEGKTLCSVYLVTNEDRWKLEFSQANSKQARFRTA